MCVQLSGQLRRLGFVAGRQRGRRQAGGQAWRAEHVRSPPWPPWHPQPMRQLARDAMCGCPFAAAHPCCRAVIMMHSLPGLVRCAVSGDDEHCRSADLMATRSPPCWPAHPASHACRDSISRRQRSFASRGDEGAEGAAGACVPLGVHAPRGAAAGLPCLHAACRRPPACFSGRYPTPPGRQERRAERCAAPPRAPAGRAPAAAQGPPSCALPLPSVLAPASSTVRHRSRRQALLPPKGRTGSPPHSSLRDPSPPGSVSQDRAPPPRPAHSASTCWAHQTSSPGLVNPGRS